MEIKSILLDKRIESFNVLVQMNIGEYLNFAPDIIDNNEFQRRKVIKTKIKEILKEDLLKGCLLPSIVLAAYGRSTNESIDFHKIEDDAEKIIWDSIEKREIIIIDGLQRTHVMLALKEELESKKQFNELDSFLKTDIRAEVYIGLKRMGLLYRMITLNTGQTTMSTRHLMEILYHDYANIQLGQIKLISDKDDTNPPLDTNSYIFKDMLDGFNSYIEKDEGLFKRTEILDNIRSLDILKDEVSVDKDLFSEFINSYKLFLDSIDQKSNHWKLNTEYLSLAGVELKASPFADNVLALFKRSQPLTGFGAALGILKEKKKIGFDEINKSISKIYFPKNDWENGLSLMILYIDIINTKSNNIGNDQRFYFKTFFRALFDPEGDQYLNFTSSADFASSRTRDDRL